MKTTRFSLLLLVLVLVLAVAAPVSADDLTPTETPPPVDETTSPHPLIAVLAGFFGDPAAVPVEGQPTTAEQIAAYHADGMGFGVLVKFYAIAAESKAACEGQSECVPLTVEELVSAFKSGVGIGNLFKDHGKPAVLGVGQIKNGNNGKGKNK